MSNIIAVPASMNIFFSPENMETGMIQQCELFNTNNSPNTTISPQYLGPGLSVEIRTKNKKNVAVLYKSNIVIKSADLSDHVAKRLFIIEAVQHGAIKLRLAAFFDISRQTIDNYLQTVEQFGLTGLLNNYSPARGINIREQRRRHAPERHQGNTAQQLAEIRKQKREQQQQNQLSFLLSIEPRISAPIAPNDHPYACQHSWKTTRYAGVFIYLMTMASIWKWLNVVTGYFGAGYKIFMVFLLMAAKNIRSIEALKNVRLEEAGLLLGIGKLVSRPVLWQWFYAASQKRQSLSMLKDYFLCQVRSGLVGVWLWFIDGHLLPYTGKERVHYAFNTQRRMPVPGRTSMVMTDESGRIVDFEIQEGKGDLRAYILATKSRWKDAVSVEPVRVFDREGRGMEFFLDMVDNQIPFVTWETNIDNNELDALDDAKFVDEFELNGKQYRVFEQEKIYTVQAANVAGTTDDRSKRTFSLRHIFLWNKSCNRRVCGLAWTGLQHISTQECACAILTRWGASENTFKHFNQRHPGNYQPGFSFSESDNQSIANPEIAVVDKKIRTTKKNLDKLYKQLTKTTDVHNDDGTVRKNNVKEKVKAEIARLEAGLKENQVHKKGLPERIDLGSLTNYDSIKEIDNEGKNLFDFVTTSAWNARKQMVDWLQPMFNNKNEVVDLFYAIADCQGWIQCTAQKIIVRLEPLQQPKRRAAQEQLCRKLTSLCAKTPMGKAMVIEVGGSPL